MVLRRVAILSLMFLFVGYSFAAYCCLSCCTSCPSGYVEVSHWTEGTPYPGCTSTACAGGNGCWTTTMCCCPKGCGGKCGQQSDGCGGTIDCGCCLLECDGRCGNVTDGCGGLIDCGCCVQECGERCGNVSDGCGDFLDCGCCVQECEERCGNVSNGCDDWIDCGCCIEECGERCGNISDGCGDYQDCGICFSSSWESDWGAVVTIFLGLNYSELPGNFSTEFLEEIAYALNISVSQLQFISVEETDSGVAVTFVILSIRDGPPVRDLVEELDIMIRQGDSALDDGYYTRDIDSSIPLIVRPYVPPLISSIAISVISVISAGTRSGSRLWISVIIISSILGWMFV